MNEQSNPIKPRPTPLPTTVAEWEAARKVKSDRTLNDHVEDIHLVLLNHKNEETSKKYNQLLDAVYDEDAVEGSLAADNVLVAQMIREYADQGGNDTYIANKKLATIVKALGVVLRRYGWSRSQRARTVGGEIVPNGNE